MCFDFCSYSKSLYFMSTFAFVDLDFFFFLKGALQNKSPSPIHLDLVLLGVGKDFNGEIISELRL